MVGFIEKTANFLNKYLTLFVILITVIALILPSLFIPMAKIKIGTLSLTSVLLSVIMFSTGMSIKANDVLEILKKPKDVIIGVLGKFMLMSLGAFVIAKLLGLNDQLAFGLIILGCMPSGTVSSVITLLANGDLSLAVAIVMIGTLLAPLLTPALTYLLAGAWVNINFMSMFTNILIIVLIPIVLGMIVRGIFKEKCDAYKKVIALITIISVLIIVGTSTAPNKNSILSMNSVIVIIAVVLNFAVAAGGSGLLAKALKMNRKKTIALVITTSEQNSALAVGIAGTFSAVYPAAVIPSIIAVSINVILATIVGNLLRVKENESEAVKTVDIK